tara:strand:+ start:795 stop:1151 length:357 start_codon:yes stop_codon:yes gene_type:complete
MAQSTSSGFHTHSSWGRTRRPKNVNGAKSTAHAVSGTEYFTENQRFLHIQTGSAATVTKIELYYHATGQWATFAVDTPLVAVSEVKIYEIDGADKVKITRTGDNSDDTKKVWLMLSTF